MAGNWLLIVSTGFVLSVPRYSLVLFALPVFGALILDRWRPVGVALAVVSARGDGVLRVEVRHRPMGVLSRPQLPSPVTTSPVTVASTSVETPLRFCEKCTCFTSPFARSSTSPRMEMSAPV